MQKMPNSSTSKSKPPRKLQRKLELPKKRKRQRDLQKKRKSVKLQKPRQLQKLKRRDLKLNWQNLPREVHNGKLLETKRLFRKLNSS